MQSLTLPVAANIVAKAHERALKFVGIELSGSIFVEVVECCSKLI